MNVTQVKAGDVVEVEMRGWTFLAHVESVVKKKGAETELNILPAVKNCSHHHCHASDVKRHWAKQGRIRQAKPKKAPAKKEEDLAPIL